MAAIATTALTGGDYHRTTGTAQADTGQTTWFAVPGWARSLEIWLNVTAVAGTTPILTPSIMGADPVTMDDGSVVAMAVGTTPPTDAGTHIIRMGPGVTGIADDLALAATGDSQVSYNASLPKIVGTRLVLDRTTGDETYTYSITTIFKK